MSERIQTASTETTADPFFYGWRYVWETDENGDMRHVQRPLTAEDVLHPEEDDFIMNHIAHDTDVVYLRDVLARISAIREKTRVLREVRVDWGVPGVRAHGPDVVFFTNVREVERRSRGTYKPKDFDASPLLVIEVTSPSTRAGDLDAKVNHYYKAGIPYYAIVDYLPETGLNHAVVLGYRATADGYVRLPLDERGRLWLEPIGLWLTWEHGFAVCYDNAGERILTDAELDVRLREVETRSEELSDLAEEAILARKDSERREADAAKLAAAEARKRADAESRAADEARKRADAESRAADEARKRADAESRSADLAALVAQLQAQLRQSGGAP